MKDLFPNRWWTLLWTCSLVGLAVLPFVANDYVVGIGLTLLMWLALTQSWCLLSKMTGYVSLGHVVFYGIGAYLVVVTWQEIALPLAILGAGLLAALVAALVGLPVLRVRGPYFVILTFGLAELVKYIITWMESASGVASRILFGAPDLPVIYFSMFALALVSVAMLTWVGSSRFGHGLRSLRENEEAAETLGVPVVRYKLIAFVLGAAIPGMVGAVMALRSTYFVVGQVFDPMISVTVIAMAILGGGDNARGPLLGVIFLSLLSEMLWVNAPLLYLVILGAILMVFVLIVPNGLLGLFERKRAADARADIPPASAP